VEDIDVAVPTPSGGPPPGEPGRPPVPEIVAAPGADGPFPVIRIGNLKLAVVTLPDAVDWIVQRSVARSACVVLTSNIFHLMLADQDEEFRRVAETCELNVADGWPLVAASRLLGTRVPERIAGIDLVAGLLQVPQSLDVAILGGAPGVADMLADRVRRRHDVVLVDPLEKDVWASEPYMRRLRRELTEAQPNLVLVGIGAPRQEILSDSLRDVVRGPIIGCGQTIDVLGGVRPRAPRALRSAGLEWAFRLGMEPRRLGRRYTVAGTRFVRLVVRELREERRRRRRIADGDG